MNRTTAEERSRVKKEIIQPPEEGRLLNFVDRLIDDYEDALKRIEELEKQKDNAYSERNKCVIGLALLARDLGYRVGLAKHPEEDTAWDNDWRNIIFIELPTGQITWHLHDSEMLMTYSFCQEDYDYDGHTTDEKYKRLLSYTPQNYAQLTAKEAQDEH